MQDCLADSKGLSCYEDVWMMDGGMSRTLLFVIPRAMVPLLRGGRGFWWSRLLR